MDVYIRKAINGDQNLILNSFLKSWRNSDFAKDINNSTYFKYLEQIIKNKLLNSDINVACDPENPTQIFGWIISKTYKSGEQKILAIDYVWVKEIWRDAKIAQALINNLEPAGKSVINTVRAEGTRNRHLCKLYKSQHNPFLFFKE